MGEQVERAVLRRRQAECAGDAHIAIRRHGSEIHGIAADAGISGIIRLIHRLYDIVDKRKIVRQRVGDDIACDRQQAHRAGRPVAGYRLRIHVKGARRIGDILQRRPADDTAYVDIAACLQRDPAGIHRQNGGNRKAFGCGIARRGAECPAWRHRAADKDLGVARSLVIGPALEIAARNHQQVAAAIEMHDRDIGHHLAMGIGDGAGKSPAHARRRRQGNRQFLDVASGLHRHIAADAHQSLIEAAEIDPPAGLRGRELRRSAQGQISRQRRERPEIDGGQRSPLGQQPGCEILLVRQDAIERRNDGGMFEPDDISLRGERQMTAADGVGGLGGRPVGVAHKAEAFIAGDDLGREKAFRIGRNRNLDRLPRVERIGDGLQNIARVGQVHGTAACGVNHAGRLLVCQDEIKPGRNIDRAGPGAHDGGGVVGDVDDKAGVGDVGDIILVMAVERDIAVPRQCRSSGGIEQL